MNRFPHECEPHPGFDPHSCGKDTHKTKVIAGLCKSAVDVLSTAFSGNHQEMSSETLHGHSQFFSSFSHSCLAQRIHAQQGVAFVGGLFCFNRSDRQPDLSCFRRKERSTAKAMSNAQPFTHEGARESLLRPFCLLRMSLLDVLGQGLAKAWHLCHEGRHSVSSRNRRHPALARLPADVFSRSRFQKEPCGHHDAWIGGQGVQAIHHCGPPRTTAFSFRRCFSPDRRKSEVCARFDLDIWFFLLSSDL